MSKKRSIFEEVGAAEPQRQVSPAGGLIDARPKGARAAIRGWLIALFVLVATMIAVGGATRLSDAGLSITEWRPVTGALPPLSEADWQAEFTKYQASPQARLMNPDMALAEFKTIYWWEWGHRQLGRVIGLVWAAGFAFFALSKRIPPGWTPRLLGLGVLGGAQGAIGWWMVASGLTGEMTSVASYRLAVHLGLGFAILGLIAWYVLALSRSEAQLLQARRLAEPKLFGMATGVMHLTFVQILLGALVAGIDAGRSYIDWPLMAGQFFPAEAFDLTPLWTNFFENPALVQFIHRITGYLVVILALVAAVRGRRSAQPVTQMAFAWMGAAALMQMALGIVTVMHAAPMGLGLAHQIGAIVLFVLILRARHCARYPIIQSIRGSK